MFSVVIIAVALLAPLVESGLYHNPNDIYHPETNYLPAQNVPHEETLVNVEVPAKSVSYSISANDYNYLKQYKNGQQDAQYNSYNVGGGAPAVASQLPCKKYLGHNNIVSNEASISSQSDFVNPHPVYTPAVQPIIKKHIYFHVPPPEAEEEPIHQVRPVQPAKKTYNILFIKAPSQDYSYSSNLQDLLRHPQSNVEEKTLIYVLVKKPDPQPEIVAPVPPKTSEHEVFYVKYKERPGVVAEPIKDNVGDAHVDEVASVLNSVVANQDVLLK